MAITESDARQRLVQMVRQDITANGWSIKDEYVSRKNSTYLRCRKGEATLTVRVSDHPPVRKVGRSIHPGGASRSELIRQLKSHRRLVASYFLEWLDA